MNTKFALLLLLAGSVSACTSVKTTSTQQWSDDKSARYAAAPAEPEADIPAQGPADINVNPAYMPTPLLRASAAGGP